jgi:serine/threonine protein kinase
MISKHYINESEDSAIITDIGEGKMLDGRDIETGPGRSYGALGYRAPEIRGTQNWTTAADVFSFGVLCSHILQFRAQVCTERPPAVILELFPASTQEEMIPTEIKKVVQECLSVEPTARPAIRSVITDLERVARKFWFESEGYTPQTALKDEPEELLKQIHWSTVNLTQELALAKGLMSARDMRTIRTRDSILDED